MEIKFIKILLLVLNILFITGVLAQNKKSEDFFADSTWSMSYPNLLSPDGQWAVIGKHNNNGPISKLYFVNTKTKDKKDFSHFSNFYRSFLNKGVVVGNIKKDLAIFSLNQNDSLLIKDVVKFDTNFQNNLLFQLKNNGDFTVTELHENLKRNKVLFSLTNIDKYYLSPNTNQIVVINKQRELLYIDLKKISFKKILSLDKDISTFKWNITQDGFGIKTNNTLILVNLNSLKVKNIDLTKWDNIENLEFSFFLNNDLYLSYQIKSNQTIPYSEYLDIWQGNSKLLFPSDFNIKYKKRYEAFVYNDKQDTIIPLERKIDKDYLNIGIPGYLLSYNYFKNIDFNDYFPSIEYSLYDINKQKNVTFLSLTSQSPFSPAIDGKHILYPVNYTKDKWEILNLSTLEKYSFDADNLSKGFTPIWSHDSKTIFYSFKNNLYSYNLENRKTIKLTQFKNSDNIHIGRLNRESIPSYTSYVNTNKPFYFTVTQAKNKTVYVFDKQKVKPIYSSTKNLTFPSTNNKLYSNDYNTVLFTIEDYDLPTKTLSFQNKEISTIMESDIDKDLYKWRKRVDFTFTDKYNKPLNGYLFYPKNYDSNKKYPMIVQIYDLQLISNPDIFSIPLHIDSDSGFNSSLLTENEYFVLSAQTYVTEEGPGISALDCVTSALEKATEIEPTIDKENLGLIGHSFGGYKTSAISVLSDLFKASVSGASVHDLISSMFRYSNYRKMPDWFMTEGSQTKMNVKFSEDSKKYYNNSPILNAHKTNTAMLLFTGLQDENVHWENTRKMFIALKREQKPVIALFYKNIIHGFSLSNPKEKIDLSIRVLDWFDYHLKNKETIPWIKDGLDYNKYSISPK
ncbi:prolyl oligopeptidase family serine peptidase [Myroides odoratimimus]|uniref:S9 family peptidase n=1 Tax=Myroides odoratimimus TaxID=76832 RepID=UPI002578B0B1|nr:prolyl oligopeptidase family serine peptidase [Myroides odoratimimus]MDM1412124.1 prolyl oligopeptidase family serine peptidase [Myroides odoratimimus]